MQIEAPRNYNFFIGLGTLIFAIFFTFNIYPNIKKLQIITTKQEKKMEKICKYNIKNDNQNILNACEKNSPSTYYLLISEGIIIGSLVGFIFMLFLYKIIEMFDNKYNKKIKFQKKIEIF